MSNIEACFRFTMRWEGGSAYTNDPADPGGPTKYGVTLRTLRDFTGNQQLNALDVQALTEAQAAEIFRTRYFEPMQGNKLPAPIALMAVDYAYNSGRHSAVLGLQRVIGSNPDGIMGPLTVAAANATPVDSFISAYGAERLTHLQSLPHWSTFGKGWTNRVMDSMAEARKLIEEG